jgi:hypothetical protein
MKEGIWAEDGCLELPESYGTILLSRIGLSRSCRRRRSM